MLRMSLIFLIIALVCSLFGFGLIAALSFDGFKVLFFVFLALAVIAFISDAIGTKNITPGNPRLRNDEMA
jgi:uncharacterized membrane protein YtjA (UPF0391 family)